jgi:hypothetical protein
MIRRNIGNVLFVLCMVLMTLSPIMLYSISQSIVSQVHESKKDVYGAYTDIYYEDQVQDASGVHFTEADLNALIPGFHYEDFGVFYSVYKEEVDTKMIRLGYGDATAISLGRVTLLHGTLPKEGNEIALTTGIMDALDVQAIGEQVTIDQTEYTVVGEVEDFGWLWPKGEKQAKTKEGPVNAFVCEAKAESLYDANGFIHRQILITREKWIANATESNDNFYSNPNSQMMPGEGVFQIPQAFLYILYASSVFILFNVLSLSRKRVSDRMHIYHLLGMVRKDQLFCVRMEYFILGVLGLIIGTAGSYLGTKLSLLLLARSTGFSFHVIIPQQIVVGTVLILLFSMTVVVFIQSQFAIRSDTAPANQKRMKSKRNGIVRLAFMEFVENKRMVLSFILLIAMSLALVSYCAVYQQKFSKSTDLISHPSLLPVDYDFEFYTCVFNGTPADDDTVHFGTSYELDGTTEEIVQQLMQEEGVGKVLPFRENNKMDILMPADRMDTYTDASDFIIDGVYEPVMGLLPDMRNLFGYKDDEILIDSLLLGYPTEILQDLSSYIVEGELHLDKLASGEEVILMVPAITIEDKEVTEGSAVMMDYPDYLSPDAMNCTIFQVGDEITMSGLMSSERFNGAVSQKDATDHYRRIDVKVRIGAIIRARVGKFSYSTFENCFAVLTLNEAFDAMGIPADYNRVRIYSDNTVDPLKMSETMAGYMADQPYMILEDLQSELGSYKRLNFVIDVFLGTIMTLVILVNAVSLSTQMLTKTRLNMNKYALLRINGLSIKRIRRMWQIQCLTLGLGGLLVGIPITAAVLQLSFQMNIAEILAYLSPGKWAAIFLLLCVLIGSSMIPSILYLGKQKDNTLSKIN